MAQQTQQRYTDIPAWFYEFTQRHGEFVLQNKDEHHALEMKVDSLTREVTENNRSIQENLKSIQQNAQAIKDSSTWTIRKWVGGGGTILLLQQYFPDIARAFNGG